MYRIASAAGSQWAIVDETDRVWFVGTPRECEDWLDLQENLQRQQQKRAHWRRFISSLMRFFRRDPASAIVGPVTPQAAAPLRDRRAG
jgi:hypothetical protein